MERKDSGSYNNNQGRTFDKNNFKSRDNSKEKYNKGGKAYLADFEEDNKTFYVN